MLIDIIQYEIPKHLAASVCQKLFLTQKGFKEERDKLLNEKKTIYCESYLRNLKYALRHKSNQWIREWLPYIDHLSRGFHYGVKYGHLEVAQHFFFTAKENANNLEPNTIEVIKFVCNVNAEFKYVVWHDNTLLRSFLISCGANNWNSAYLQAVSRRNTEAMNFFKDKISELDRNELMAAAIKGNNTKLIDELMAAEISPSDEELHAAIEMDNMAIIANRFPEIVGDQGLINKAARCGHLNMVKYFIERGARCNSRVLAYACCSENMELIDFILSCMKLRGKNLQGAIASAASKGRTNIIEKLLDLCPHIYFSAAIHAAAITGRRSVIELLLSHKRFHYYQDINTSVECTIKGHHDMLDVIKMKL